MTEVRVNNLLRGHFTRRGQAKVKHTREAAWQLANEKHMTAYRCDFCSMWHVATKKGTP